MELRLPTQPLSQGLSSLEEQLQPQASASSNLSTPSAQAWLQDAQRSNSSAPLMLAIAQQLAQLQGLLRSRSLVVHTIQAQGNQRR